MDLEKLKFPIGRFETPTEFSNNDIKSWIADISTFPSQLQLAVVGITENQLNTPYRHGGWTVRQVIHHLADSHSNGIIRTKLALTENNPTIKPYAEDLWANLPDYNLPIESSLKIIEGIHLRWSNLLSSLDASELERTFFHPEHQKSFSLKTQIANYAWHGKHHLAHIKLVTLK